MHLKTPFKISHQQHCRNIKLNYWRMGNPILITYTYFSNTVFVILNASLALFIYWRYYATAAKVTLQTCYMVSKSRRKFAGHHHDNKQVSGCRNYVQEDRNHLNTVLCIHFYTLAINIIWKINPDHTEWKKIPVSTRISNLTVSWNSYCKHTVCIFLGSPAVFWGLSQRLPSLLLMTA